MAKITIWALAMVFAFGSMATNGFSEEQMGTGMGRPAALSGLVGTYVTTPQGEHLGRITDFVIDSQGHAAFIILAHGGFLRIGEREVAIPFHSFAYDRTAEHFVLDSTRDKLASAPLFTMRDLYNEKWAEEVYRHFGQAPYWTEGELVEKGIEPPREPMSSEDTPYYPFGYTP